MSLQAEAGRYRAALYMRLSKDDEGAGESASITNQRNILAAYAGEHRFIIAGEYVDDGWSGTDFDRPGFQRMIRDIESGRINLVLTKDLSRLGRDYIRIGEYTEVYFPSKKVRYIAVNDGYDTEGQYTDIAPFKNVVNEMYARDASKKIRSAITAKMKNGCYIGNFAPYGYRKDPEDKNHLIPDETSGKVVRQIFQKAFEGLRPADIAGELNAQGVLCPSGYRHLLHSEMESGVCLKNREWTSAAVARILRNIVYLGHTAQGKTTKISFKSKVTLSKPQSEWIIVKNTHVPLVDARQFDQVRRRMKSRICKKSGKFTNAFSGIAICADCRRNMSAVGTRKKDSQANLACGGYKARGRELCSNHFIDYDDLYQIVMREIQEHIKLTDQEREKLTCELEDKLKEESAPSSRSDQKKLKEELGGIDGLIGQLYEDKLQGRIDEHNFYRLLQKYQKRSRELTELISSAGSREPAKKSETKDLERLIQKYRCIRKLEGSMLREMVDHIEIGQGRYEEVGSKKVKIQHIKIYFRFLVKDEKKEVDLGEIPLDGQRFAASVH